MSHLRISSNPISSDLIPYGTADIILSVEPMESLRYLNYLAKTGWVITNTKSFENINNYPDYEKLINTIKELPQRVFIDADEIAHEAGSVKSSNMVMLGASVPFLKLSVESIEQGISSIFASKGKEIVELNLKAMKMGMDYSVSAR